jgi:hypothetical protein
VPRVYSRFTKKGYRSGANAPKRFLSVLVKNTENSEIFRFFALLFYHKTGNKWSVLSKNHPAFLHDTRQKKMRKNIDENHYSGRRLMAAVRLG